jgi:two-component sensor histidine kinase
MVFAIEDDGIGLSNDFNINSIRSVGLNLVSMMIYGLNGKIQFVPGNGTKIIIEIPYKALEVI